MPGLIGAFGAIWSAGRALFGDDRVSESAFSRESEVLAGSGSLVLAYHATARRAGEQVLEEGGNAFDAFTAAVIVENVIAEGASSLAGSLTALVHQGPEGLTHYLDGGFDDPLEPASDKALRKGGAVLVPGTPAALAELSARFGRLPFARLLQPGIALAEEGFPATRLMCELVRARRKVLERSAFGRDTYLAGGVPRPGDRIRAPEIAAFLRHFAEQGPDYVYRGPWAAKFLATVHAAGGNLGAEDLERYRAVWDQPHEGSFRGRRLLSSSGRSYGGLWTQLALAASERAETSGDFAGLSPLVARMAIARSVWCEGTLFDPARLDSREGGVMSSDPDRVLSRALAGADPSASRSASHSYAVIVRDREGNLVNGTTTAQSEPWGDGLFIEGLSLTHSGRTPFGVAPGERRLSPFSQHLVIEDGIPALAVGTISNSAAEAAFQLLDGLVGSDRSLAEAVREPRFGTFPPKRWRWRPTPDLKRMWVDPRISAEVGRALAGMGLRVSTRTPVDTGLGAVMRFRGGAVEGAMLPLPYLEAPFAETAP